MNALPKLLASTVIRSSRRGESHGSLYLIDLETESFELVLDWASTDIDWTGVGGDRGLRGIAFTQDGVWVAAASKLLLFDRDFRLEDAFTNPYLGHCHEIALLDQRLYLTSTAFDAVLEFDLAEREFIAGLGVRLFADGQLSYRSFHPESGDGPDRRDSMHLNNVVSFDDRLYISGRGLPFLFEVCRHDLRLSAQIPLGTHNPRPFRGGLLLNDTDSSGVALLGSRFFPELLRRFPAPALAPQAGPGVDAGAVTQPGFCRGLCVLDEGTLFAAGSSPATVVVHSSEAVEPIRSIRLTRDVNHSIHGLAVWPFG